jgi:phage terminase large subunit
VEVNLPYVPTPRQSQAHRAVERFVLYGGAVGGGKSAWLCNEGLQLSLDYPGNVGYLARHELVSFRRTTMLTLEQFLPPQIVRTHNKSDQEIVLVNSSKILYGGLGDDQSAIERLKSLNLGWFGIDQAEETTESHYFMLASRLRLVVPNIRYKGLLTANPEPGWVRDRWVENHNPDHIFIPALPADNPHLPPDYESTLRQLYSNNPALIKALLEGNWDVSTASDYLIAYSLIRSAIARQVPLNGNCTLGVDVARFGDDETVVAVRRGLKTTRLESWVHQDTTWTAGKVAEIARMENPSTIYVDEIGVGVGVVDPLRNDHFNVVGIISSEAARKSAVYANRRAELYVNLAGHFEDGSISILDHPKLSSQLAGIKYKYDTHHRKIIESKDDLRKRNGRSPDYADALMLAFSDFTLETPSANEPAELIYY